jgi:tetrahydromethanopterin S-methyltransferase subunit B
MILAPRWVPEGREWLEERIEELEVDENAVYNQLYPSNTPIEAKVTPTGD